MAALRTLLSALPADLPASLFVVQHMGEETLLPRLLADLTPLAVVQPQGSAPVRPGEVYLPRPNHHLVLDLPLVRQLKAPRENGFRPSIDVLFRSAARYDSRCVGVLLTGGLDDGVAGLAAIRRHGGLALVQDPAGAEDPTLPTAAIRYAHPDQVLPLADLPRAIVEATRSSKVQMQAVNGPMKSDSQVIEKTIERQLAGERADRPSVYSCPDCGGVMWAIKDGDLVRYRCHTGHGYTEEALLRAQDGKLEEALDGAVRLLRERAMMYETLRRRAEDREGLRASMAFADQANQAREHSRRLEQLLGELAQHEEQSAE